MSAQRSSQSQAQQLILSGVDTGWENWTDDELLGIRMCDLKLAIEGTVIENRVNALYAELTDRGLVFTPPCYLSTEWLTPDRIPTVGIPFYLAHPRLIRLERTMMAEAEGEKERDCMRLLRHETGHAINYAYEFFKKTRWRELFGNMSEYYDPHRYYMRPYSKQYVIHLKGNYAQAHPDEDFAETFAVWLTPGLDWRKRYKDWGALAKLEYVDHLMQSIVGKGPIVKGGPRHFAAAHTRSTLRTYYRNKQKVFGEGYHGFYDPLLLKIFTAHAGKEPVKADRFLIAYRKALTDSIAQWSRLPKYAIRDLLIRLAQRAREMKLYLRDDHTSTMLSVGVSVTAQLMSAQESDGENEE